MTKEAKIRESLTKSYSLQTPEKIDDVPFESNWSYGIVVQDDPVNYFDPFGLASEKDGVYYDDNGNIIGEAGLEDPNPFLDPLNLIGGFGGIIKGEVKAGASCSLKAIGGKITGYTKHGLNQAISRNGTGVNPKSILNAVRNPEQILKKSGGITEYVGENATVRLNEAGKVVTTFPNNSSGWRIPR